MNVVKLYVKVVFCVNQLQDFGIVLVCVIWVFVLGCFGGVYFDLLVNVLVVMMEKDEVLIMIVKVENLLLVLLLCLKLVISVILLLAKVEWLLIIFGKGVVYL